MRKLLLLIFCSLYLAAAGQESPKDLPGTFRLAKGLTEKDYLPNTVIVKFRAGTTAAQIRAVESSGRTDPLNIRPSGLQEIKQIFKNSLQAARRPLIPEAADTIGVDRIYELRYAENINLEEVINEILQNPVVEYAEPSYIHHTNYIPNDRFYNATQNYLKQIGADRAWDEIRNSSNVVIAIVDSGSDMDHEDLKSNIILPGKDLVGASFSNIIEDNDPGVKSDSTDHGVRVSGVASAVSDNGNGIASIAFNARLMIVKVGADNNATAIYRGYEGIKYAADQGADIINCSWSGAMGGAYGQDIINYALSKGCLIVAAAGNENSMQPEYPGSYEGVMAVSSVDNQDRKSSYSNYGKHITISAPGDVYTTGNRNSYTLGRGTSFSAPLVASAAALVKARFPHFNMLQVKEQLRVTSDNIDSRNGAYAGLLGHGRLNVYRAVTESLPSVRQQNIVLADKGGGSIPPGDTLRLFFDLKNFLSPVSNLHVKLSSDHPGIEVIDGEVDAGAIGSMETKPMVGTFKVYVRPDIADNEEVDFNLQYSTTNGYSDSEQFRIRVALDYINIEVNQVASTISSNGRIGFSREDATGGLGFIYKNEQLLYEASLMIGYSVSKVSNNARNDSGGSDDHFQKKIRVKRANDPGISFKGYAEFDDSGNPERLNIHVKSSHTAFSSAPDDRYIIAEYEIMNTGQTVLSNLYAGLFTDWDIGVSGRDVTRFDAVNHLAYVYPKGGVGIYAGVKLLNRDIAPVYYPMSEDLQSDPLHTGGGFSIAEKYQSLSNGVKSTSLGESAPNGYDVAFVSGYGPYHIPPNGSVKISFAFIAGDDLADLQTVAQAAQKKYDEMNFNDLPKPAEGLVLEQNFPNPARESTTIRFTIPEEGLASLTLYDPLGRPVREFFKSNLPEGTYSVNLNIAGLEPGIYLYKLVCRGYEKALKLLVTR